MNNNKITITIIVKMVYNIQELVINQEDPAKILASLENLVELLNSYREQQTECKKNIVNILKGVL